ncbi:MAG: outer membrane lipoprotein LolB [Hydrogenophaga sp.]|jgi:outer membrane lipoprotein LolB|nr:outer membrane lipoprotein LolB [Hydrogenophaga sp.]
MKRLARRTVARQAVWVLVAGLLTACATPRPPASPGESSWSGRLALTVDSTPLQSFAAGFDLHGTPLAGQLLLTSPLGQTVASVQWSPGSAEWRQGEQVTRRATLDQLTTELVGTALPVAALFGWLNGEATPASGWQVDLNRHPEGRVFARRTQPLPSAELRIIFQP